MPEWWVLGCGSLTRVCVCVRPLGSCVTVAPRPFHYALLESLPATSAAPLLFLLPPCPTLDVRDSFAVGVLYVCVRRMCAPNIYHPFIEQRA